MSEKELKTRLVLIFCLVSVVVMGIFFMPYITEASDASDAKYTRTIEILRK